MNLRIYGINSKITKNEIRQCTKYMYGILAPPHIYNNTSIRIYNTKLPKKICGSTIKNKNELKCKIKINVNESKKQQLITLAHELVHVKQYCMNELVEMDSKGLVVMYKKEIIKSNELEYYDWPWEIEAHGRMYGLYKMWDMYKKEHKLKFK